MVVLAANHDLHAHVLLIKCSEYADETTLYCNCVQGIKLAYRMVLQSDG